MGSRSRHVGEFPHDQVLKKVKNKSPQDQLSMPAAMALNYCCTAACIRDYIKQGLNISCLDYKYVSSCQNIFFTTSCNYLRQGPGCPSWGSLGQSRLLLRSWPNQCKATGGPQKVSSCIKTWVLLNQTWPLQGFSARGISQSWGSPTSREGRPSLAARPGQVSIGAFFKNAQHIFENSNLPPQVSRGFWNDSRDAIPSGSAPEWRKTDSCSWPREWLTIKGRQWFL